MAPTKQPFIRRWRSSEPSLAQNLLAVNEKSFPLTRWNLHRKCEVDGSCCRLLLMVYFDFNFDHYLSASVSEFATGAIMI